MPKARNYPAHRGPGAGRPKNLQDPEGPPPDLAVFVEGRVRVSGDDDEGFERIGRLREAAEPLGLVLHSIPVQRDDLTTVRRMWGNERVDLAFAEGWIKDYPGITFLEWTEKVFLAGQPMSEVAFSAARAKAKVALSKLWRGGSVRKDKNAYGQMTIWPANGGIAKPDDVPADIKLACDEMTKAAIEAANRKGKTLSTLSVVNDVVEMVWKKRLYYER